MFSKPEHWEPSDDDLDFERDAHHFLTDLSDRMMGNPVRLYPVRRRLQSCHVELSFTERSVPIITT